MSDTFDGSKNDTGDRFDSPTFHAMWRSLRPIGHSDASGGYRRYAWTGADADCRLWFQAQAEARGLDYEVDRNGNQWAWLGDPARGDAVVTGSHLDSVPDGGAFDGPLGVVSSFAALDELRARKVQFRRPSPSPTSATRKAPASASPASGPGWRPGSSARRRRTSCATRRV